MAIEKQKYTCIIHTILHIPEAITILFKKYKKALEKIKTEEELNFILQSKRTTYLIRMKTEIYHNMNNMEEMINIKLYSGVITVNDLENVAI